MRDIEDNSTCITAGSSACVTDGASRYLIRSLGKRRHSLPYQLILLSTLLIWVMAVGRGEARDWPMRSLDSLRTAQSVQRPAVTITDYCSAYHSAGKVGMLVDNQAALIGMGDLTWDTVVTCYLGPYWHFNGEYPFNSRIEHLYGGGLWFGGILNGDTLVSAAYTGGYEGSEFRAERYPFGAIRRRSTIDPEKPEYVGAISEEDFVSSTTDTFKNVNEVDFLTQRQHRPLNIAVSLKSYAWSTAQSDDFVLFDWEIENIGEQPIRNAYVGLHMDCDVWHHPFEGIPSVGTSTDDVVGFLRTLPAQTGCGFVDTLDVPWVADNDGDPKGADWIDTYERRSCRGIAALKTLAAPGLEKGPSFNWWVYNYDAPYDWGPRAKPSTGVPYRDFRTGGLGSPLGDANKYYMMSNGEMDYDLTEMSRIGYNNGYWMAPGDQMLKYYGSGADVYYVLSYGPFDLWPGETVPLAFAFVLGQNFHTDPLNLRNLQSGRIAEYTSTLDFSDLQRNIRFAEMTYDNPGYDTDLDGYFGSVRVCVLDSVLTDTGWVSTVAETTWYKGDGVPDWRAATPPPPPVFWLMPTKNGVHVRFNGYRSETTKDLFSGKVDFEGYRIYLGRDEREASLSLMTSYDRQDYDKWVYHRTGEFSGEYRVDEVPFTLEELRCRYGHGVDRCADTLFDPLAYTLQEPLVYRDSMICFSRHEQNAWELGGSGRIWKTYPDAPKPQPRDTLNPEATTPDGYFKYYEYEFEIEHLLPTVPYFINVTAFDFGSPEVGLEALETSKTHGTRSCYPLADDEQLGDSLPPVYVYPNPYRVDGDYRGVGYEGRGDGRIADRLRRIHFVNVPAKCIIRIHTLDGDLVRALNHDMDPSDPNSRHETWDLINRNIQTVESGLYFWSVEDASGRVQLGKFVVIR